MNIFCELWDKFEPICLKITKKNNNFNTTIFDSTIENVLANHKIEEIQYAFLNENKFKIYNFDIFENFDKKITIENIDKIIEQKLFEIYKKFGQFNTFAFYTINNILINWQPKKYLIWESWLVFFKLSFYFLKPEILQQYQLKFPKNFKLINFFPNSLFTIKFIQESLKKQSFFLLYIDDSVSKLVQVYNWFYKQIEFVNIWINMLKDTYQENNIFDLFFATEKELEFHPLVKDIVYQSVDFFTQMLAKWLRQYINQNNDLILISSLSRNIFFQKQFNKRYNHFINWFILPFSYSNTLNVFNKKRDPQELNILTFLNYLPDLNKIIHKI